MRVTVPPDPAGPMLETRHHDAIYERVQYALDSPGFDFEYSSTLRLQEFLLFGIVRVLQYSS